MHMKKEKIYSCDRFLPTRGLIDFDAAFYNLLFHEPDSQKQTYLPGLPGYNKGLEFKKNLEKMISLNSELFKISLKREEVIKSLENQIWPCFPRKKPFLTNEKILDMPGFNGDFYLNTIDWGSNNAIVTSVMNRIVVGKGFADGCITAETIIEYEDDIGTAVSWSRDGIHLAIGTKYGFVQAWNMTTRKQVMEVRCSLNHNCTITALQWHPSHHGLAWACSKGKISSLNLRDNFLTEVEFAHHGCICNLKYSPQANYLCSSGQDGNVRIWRGDSCEPHMEIEMCSRVPAVAWHPWRSGLLAVGEGIPSSSSLSIWNVNTAKMLYMAKPSKPLSIKALEFNKLSGELVCSQCVHNNFQDKEHCEIIVLGGPDYIVDILPQINECVTTLLWSPDGTQLGTAGTDETLNIWKFYKPRDDFKRNYGTQAFNATHYTVR